MFNKSEKLKIWEKSNITKMSKLYTILLPVILFSLLIFGMLGTFFNIQFASIGLVFGTIMYIVAALIKTITNIASIIGTITIDDIKDVIPKDEMVKNVSLLPVLLFRVPLIIVASYTLSYFLLSMFAVESIITVASTIIVNKKIRELRS